MSANERLREILTEVQGLREREAQSLKQTTALLDMLEAVTTAVTPQAAIRAFLGEVARSLRADAVAILRIDKDLHTPVAHWPENSEITAFTPPTDLGRKFRTYFDLGTLPAWDACFQGDLAGTKSLLSAPIEHPDGGIGAVVCFHPTPNHFVKADAQLLRRLSRFAAQILGALQLSAQNALLAAVIDGSSSGFAIADATRKEMPLVFVNNAFERMTGYSKAEVLGKNCRFLSADPDDSPERTRLRQTVAAREFGTFLLHNRKKSGDLFWNDLTLFPVKDEAGNATHLVATQSDASERVALEGSRRDAQAKLTATLAHTNDAFLLVLEGGIVGFGNPALKRLFPAPNFNWAEGSRFAENWQDYIDGVPQAQRPSDRTFLNPDLTELANSVSGQRLRLPDGKQVLVRADTTEDNSIVMSATDITSLRNTERLFRQRAVAVENASDGIAIADAGGRIFYANPSLARILDAKNETDLIGRKWRSHYQTSLDIAPGLAVGNDANGTLMALKAPSETNKYHEISRTFVDKVGEVVVVRNATARIVMLERQAELDGQLERSRRREAISQLAAGLAHDFNNLLSAINGSALLIGLEDDVSDTVQNHAARIGRAGNQAARLVNRLLDLGVSGENDSVFDLRSVVTEAQDLVSTSLSPNNKLSIDLDEDAVLVGGQTGDASQVLMNLVLNANDAYDGAGGTIFVTLDRTKASATARLVVGELQAGTSYARLIIRDHGCGMSQETMDRVLEPYYTTKGATGTGVGLTMVATIVERQGGAMDLTSTEGQGTQFVVYWPLATGGSVAENDQKDQIDLSGLTLLLLDDEEQVMEVLQAYLEGFGAEVVAINDPTLAVETLLEDPEAWSALITDYDMPQMSGGDVVHQLRQAGCTIPVYLVTALARRLKDPRIGPDTVSAIFAKPLDLRQLVQTLADELTST